MVPTRTPAAPAMPIALTPGGAPVKASELEGAVTGPLELGGEPVVGTKLVVDPPATDGVPRQHNAFGYLAKKPFQGLFDRNC